MASGSRKISTSAQRKSLVSDRRQTLIKGRLNELNENVRLKHREDMKVWLATREPSHHDIVVEEVQVVKRTETPYHAFRRLCRVVLTLTRVFSAIRRARFEVDDFFKREKLKKHGTTSSGYEDLHFDAAYYKANPEYTWPDSAMDAITRAPRIRTEDDCAVVRDVMRTLPSFRKYTDDMQVLVSRVAEYCKWGKNRVIVRKGHPGHCFYFIFSGKLSVVFDKEEASVFTRPEVGVLSKGDVFGEVALLKDTVRNATVVSATECELLLIDRTAFMDFGLYNLFMEKCQCMIDFVSELDLCRTWSEGNVEDLCFVSRMEVYNYKKVIEKESGTANWLYIILKGSCEVLRLTDLTECAEFTRLVPRHEIDALRKSFRAVFFDLKSLHEFVNMVHQREQTRRKQMKAKVSISTSLLTNFSSASINTESLHTLRQYKSSHRRGTQDRSSSSGSTRNSVGSAKAGGDASKGPGPTKHVATVPGLHVDSFSGIGAFMKVDTLVSGDIYGFHAASNGSLALVSKGAEIIRVPASHFRAMSDDATRKKVDALVRVYPSERELCATIFRKTEWNIFRTNVSACLRSRGGRPSTADYFRRSESAYSFRTLSSPLPMISYTPDTIVPETDDDSLPKSMNKLRLKSAAPIGLSRRPRVTIDPRPKTAQARAHPSTSTHESRTAVY